MLSAKKSNFDKKMAGLYIHIPFCKQKCTYCNFFSIASIRLKSEFITSLIQEIESRKLELENQSIETIYFGGGTPSILNTDEIKQILKTIFQCYSVITDPEITLEANPDDLTEPYLLALKETKINRLSIGIQSFDDNILKQLNRRHSRLDALNAIATAQQIGFKNISIDLIYGIPNQKDSQWIENLEIATKLKIPHLSCYALTVEEGTMLERMIAKGKAPIPTEMEIVRQFDQLMDFAKQHSYHHYEISNFALNTQESKHNSAYWNGTPYLGFGPGAHSYTGINRRWNQSNLKLYIEGIKSNNVISDTEYLTETDHYNEYLMTALRTSNGIDLEYMHDKFNKEFNEYFNQQLNKLDSSLFALKNQQITLTRKGIHLADFITRELFKI